MFYCELTNKKGLLFSFISKSKKVIKRNKRKYLSEPQVHKLLSYIHGQADSARKKGSSRAIIDELIIHLLLKAGLRPNELCGLHIEDLPLLHGEKSLWIRNSSGEITRKVSISEELIELLDRFVTLYRKKAQQKDPLLQSERSNPFSYMSLYNKVRRIGEESCIGKLSPAILRHTYIMRLYDVEQDLRYVQEQAGYASIRTIADYVKIDQVDGNLETTQTCDACGVKITTGSGKRIESGQLICSNCLKYFRID